MTATDKPQHPALASESPAPLVWRSAFESGFTDVDNEHRELFDLANGLLKLAGNYSSNPNAFNNALGDFMLHLQRHLKHEEAFMREIGYIDAQEHALMHREIVGRAVFMRQQLDDGRGTLEQWVSFVANEVIAAHLLREDRKFFQTVTQSIEKEKLKRAK